MTFPGEIVKSAYYMGREQDRILNSVELGSKAASLLGLAIEKIQGNESFKRSLVKRWAENPLWETLGKVEFDHNDAMWEVDLGKGLGVDRLLIITKDPNKIEEVFIQVGYHIDEANESALRRGQLRSGSFSYRSYDRVMQSQISQTFDNLAAAAKVEEFLQKI